MWWAIRCGSTRWSTTSWATRSSSLPRAARHAARGEGGWPAAYAEDEMRLAAVRGRTTRAAASSPSTWTRSSPRSSRATPPWRAARTRGARWRGAGHHEALRGAYGRAHPPGQRRGPRLVVRGGRAPRPRDGGACRRRRAGGRGGRRARRPPSGRARLRGRAHPRGRGQRPEPGDSRGAHDHGGRERRDGLHGPRGGGGVRGPPTRAISTSCSWTCRCPSWTATVRRAPSGPWTARTPPPWPFWPSDAANAFTEDEERSAESGVGRPLEQAP